MKEVYYIPAAERIAPNNPFGSKYSFAARVNGITVATGDFEFCRAVAKRIKGKWSKWSLHKCKRTRAFEADRRARGTDRGSL